MTRTSRRLAAALFSATVLAGLAVSGATAAPPAGHGKAFAEVRAATARFASLKQAAKAGYGLPPAPAPLHECISSFDGTGAMGFHYINGNLLDTTVDPTKPEALVYAPDANGKLHLVALEYVVFQAPWIAAHGSEMPSLFGEMFMATGRAEPLRHPGVLLAPPVALPGQPGGPVHAVQPDRVVRGGRDGRGRSRRRRDRRRRRPDRCDRIRVLDRSCREQVHQPPDLTTSMAPT